MTPQEFGHRLKKARQQTGYLQHSVANKLGFGQPTMSSYEQGHSMPSVLTVMKMIEILGFDPRLLFPEFWKDRIGQMQTTNTVQEVTNEAR